MRCIGMLAHIAAAIHALKAPVEIIRCSACKRLSTAGRRESSTPRSVGPSVMIVCFRMTVGAGLQGTGGKAVTPPKHGRLIKPPPSHTVQAPRQIMIPRPSGGCSYAGSALYYWHRLKAYPTVSSRKSLLLAALWITDYPLKGSMYSSC